MSALLLSLILAFGSVAMAVARGQAPMGDTIALCTEAGAVTVTLDAKGNPVPASPHLCPDCLSAATAFDLPAPVVPVAPVSTARTLTLRHVALVLASTAPVQPQARGPPALSA